MTYNLALSVMIGRKTLYQMIAPIFLFPHKMQMCNNMEFIGFQYDFKIITSHLLPPAACAIYFFENVPKNTTYIIYSLLLKYFI